LLERIHQTYKGRADFYLVYIREAHPSDGWQVPMNVREGIVFNDPKTLDARGEVAAAACSKLNLTMPALVDSLDDAVNTAYAAWPDRLYVVGKGGRIAYKGAPGPRGFRADELEQFLKSQFPPPK